MIKGTGIFEGLEIPEHCRGKWVVIIRGKVQVVSNDTRKLKRAIRKAKTIPIFMRIPKENEHWCFSI